MTGLGKDVYYQTHVVAEIWVDFARHLVSIEGLAKLRRRHWRMEFEAEAPKGSDQPQGRTVSFANTIVLSDVRRPFSSSLFLFQKTVKLKL